MDTDLAINSPLSYEALHAAHRDGRLAAVLAGMTPRERVGAAALVAERTGKTVAEVLRRFARLEREAQS